MIKRRSFFPCLIFLVTLLLVLVALVIVSREGAADYDINCRLKGHIDTEGTSHNVVVSGYYAYVAAGIDGLIIVDVSDPANPWEKGRFDDSGGAYDVAVAGDYAYVAWGTRGLVILDIRDKSDPKEKARCDPSSSGEAQGIDVVGDYVYLAKTDAGVYILDVSDPGDPEVVGHYNAKYAMDVVVKGDHAFVANYDKGLLVLDISDKSDPQRVGSLDTDDHAWNLAVEGDHAYVADRNTGLVIMDISSPESPSFVSRTNTPGRALDVYLEDSYAYVGDSYEGVLMIDITDKEKPVKVGHYASEYATGITAARDHIFVADYDNGLVILEKAPVAWIDDISPNPATDVQEIEFRGHGSDDGEVTDYVWRSSIDGPLHQGTEANFSLSGLTPGEHSIYLSVRDDDDLLSDEAEFVLLVKGKLSAYISSVSSSPALDSDTVRFEGHGSDDSEVQCYVWRSDLAGELYNGSETEFETASLGIGEHTISFRVQDKADRWTTEDFLTLVIHQRPVATLESVSPGAVVEGKTVRFRGSGSDDGEVLDHLWVSNISGVLHNGSDPEFENSSLPLGNHTIFFRVMDNYGVWSEDVNTSLIVHKRPLAFIDQVPPAPVLNTSRFFLEGHGTDDGEVVVFSWRSDIDGELYNGSGSGDGSLFLGVTDLSLGSHNLSFRVMDSHGMWSFEVPGKLTIHSRPVARFARLPGSVVEGEKLSFLANGTDDGLVVLYVWNSSLDGEFYNGTESGFTRSNLSLGIHNITLRVMDNYGVWSEEAVGVVEVKKEEPFILFRVVGPLPVFGYLLLLILIPGVVLGLSKRKGKKKKEDPSTRGSAPFSMNDIAPMSFSPPAPLPPPELPGPMPGPAPSCPQQAPASSPNPGQVDSMPQGGQAWDQRGQSFQSGYQQTPQQGYGQAGLGQQQAPGYQQGYPQQSYPAQPQQALAPVQTPAPAQGRAFLPGPGGSWQCSYCQTMVATNFGFCTGCGRKR